MAGFLNGSQVGTAGSLGRALGGFSSYRRSTIEWLPSLVTTSVRIADVLIILVCAIVAHSLYLDDLPEERSTQYELLLACAGILSANIFHFARIYQFKRLPDAWGQIGRVLASLAMLFAILFAILYFAKYSWAFSRGWMAIWFGLAASTLIALRIGLAIELQRQIAKGLLARRVAIVGSGRPADRLADYLKHFPNAQIHFAGLFDDRQAARDKDTLAPSGTIDELCRLARTQQIDAIIVALPQISEARLEMILAKLKPLPVDIRLCRDTLEFCLPQSSYEFVGIVPMLRLYDRPVAGWGQLAKAIEDRTVAVLAAIALAPFMAAIALAIKLDSPGPVFFKQKRYGFNNRLITVYKFRTMYTDLTDHDATKLVTRDDPRVTRVGAFLRKTSLDELPQIFNVLMGDMSIVGPRPHAVAAKAAGERYEDVVAEYAARHRVKPGITGWAAVNGWRGETDTVEKIRERVNHDLYYIDNWSVLFDLRIIIMTVWTVLKRENAF